MPHYILLLKGSIKHCRFAIFLKMLHFRNARPLHGKRAITRKCVN